METQEREPSAGAEPSLDGDWIHVESSMIYALHWEYSCSVVDRLHGKWYPVGVLSVCFQSGDVYQYNQVSESDYLAIRHATSVGAAFSQLIRPSRRGKKIGRVSF